VITDGYVEGSVLKWDGHQVNLLYSRPCWVEIGFTVYARPALLDSSAELSFGGEVQYRSAFHFVPKVKPVEVHKQVSDSVVTVAVWATEVFDIAPDHVQLEDEWRAGFQSVPKGVEVTESVAASVAAPGMLNRVPFPPQRANRVSHNMQHVLHLNVILAHNYDDGVPSVVEGW
jgi:hypothetical protein